MKLIDKNNPSLIIMFLIIALPAMLVSGGLFYYLYTIERDNTLSVLKSVEQGRIDVQQEHIYDHFWTIIGDLRFLSTHQALRTTINDGFGAEELAADYLQLSRVRWIYDQIRYLDASGQEKIRVNYSDGQPFIVPVENLQNKAGRYYFSDTFELSRDEIFISPLDLNVERGEIERPLKPIIRFGMPVFDDQDNKQGIVLLNYLGENLLERLNGEGESVALEMMLVNPDGYWLNSPDENEEWGFMFDERRDSRFQNRYPGLWETIQQQTSGQLETADGLFTFSTLRPLLAVELQQDDTYYWKLISLVPRTAIEAQLDTTIRTFNLLFVITFFVFSTIALFTADDWRKRLLTENRLRDKQRDLSTEITHTQQAMAQVEAKNEELESAYSDLKHAQAQLLHAEKMQSVGLLAAGIAHEINTPAQFVGDNVHFLKDVVADYNRGINEINGLLKQFAEGDLEKAVLLSKIEELMASIDIEFINEEAPAAIEQSIEGLGRIARIVGAMKDFSHPGGKGEDGVNINHLIETTVTISRNEWKYVADLETNLNDDLPSVFADSQILGQAFLNLIVNAAHAIAERQADDNSFKGLIEISTGIAGSEITVTVSDNGSGIPEEIRNRIFEPFFTTKEVGKGSGQGLAVVYSAIVETHAGHVDIESEVGVGTRFILHIPIKSPIEEDDS